MLESFLLLRHTGDDWVPLFAIPGVIAAFVASVWLIISGIKRSIASRPPSQPGIPRAASPDRVVRWLARRPMPSSQKH